MLEKSEFQIVEKPRIIRSIFELNRDFIFDVPIPLEIENEVQVIKNIDETKLNSTIIFNLGIFTKSDFEKVPFKIQLTIEGNFTWDQSLQKNKDLLERMMNENAPAILYGYLRPVISLMTVDANIPPLTIPLMNFRDQS